VSGAAPRYTVHYEPRAFKELAKLDKPMARRLVRAIDRLADQPRPSGVRPLAGHPDLWRLRVGDYRAVYAIRDAELLVLMVRIAHRGTVYREL